MDPITLGIVILAGLFALAVYNRGGQAAPTDAEKNIPTVTIEELQ